MRAPPVSWFPISTSPSCAPSTPAPGSSTPWTGRGRPGGLGPSTRSHRQRASASSQGGCAFPTLAEALELTTRLDWLINVELKSFPNTDPRLPDAVLAVIDETGSALVSSSLPSTTREVARVARLRPDVATGVLAATPLFRPDEYVRERVLADSYHPSAEVLGALSDRYRARAVGRTIADDGTQVVEPAGHPGAGLHRQRRRPRRARRAPPRSGSRRVLYRRPPRSSRSVPPG